MILKCINCNKEIEYNPETIGSYNIGQVQLETGWHYATCKYSQKEIWLCDECSKEAKELINEILKIVKTPFYDFNRLIPFEIRSKFKG